MTIREFHVGFQLASRLHRLVACKAEREAVVRLQEFRGTDADLLLAVSMLDRAWDSGAALERAQLTSLLEEVA